MNDIIVKVANMIVMIVKLLYNGGIRLHRDVIYDFGYATKGSWTSG